MLTIAHRGASAYKPENTLEAFKTAMSTGSRFMETDVQLTKDGRLVLCHNYEVDGRNIKTNILKDLNLPTLEELLDILKPETKLNIEVKNDDNIYPDIERKILAVLNIYGHKLKDNILISSFDYPTLQRVRALDKQIKIGVLTRNFKIENVLALNAYSANMSLKRINEEIVKACHKENIKVFVYTVNTAKEAAQMAALGVDGIFSDYPDMLGN
ncbi:MAG: glycerophosphodiester phosphodiesterase [Elusimicrobiota bacterium]|nr:glycerophosphodiester phosphodiesterase [Elusimicrobiota bacterium]